MASSSSGRRFLFIMGTGDPTDNPLVIASATGASEYRLSVGGQSDSQPIRLDPGYEPDTTGELFSVVSVRLAVQACNSGDHVCKWAVGTNAFLSRTLPSFKRIARLQGVARVRSGLASRLAQWDLIDMTYIHDDGAGGKYVDTYESPCLPRADNVPASRGAEGAAKQAVDDYVTQYVDIYPSSNRVRELQLRGQLTLRANYGNLLNEFAPVRPADLRIEVRIFVE